MRSGDSVQRLRCAATVLPTGARPALADVVALWAEDKTTTRAFAEHNTIEFPIGYGADAAAEWRSGGAAVSWAPFRAR